MSWNTDCRELPGSTCWKATSILEKQQPENIARSFWTYTVVAKSAYDCFGGLVSREELITG